MEYYIKYFIFFKIKRLLDLKVRLLVIKFKVKRETAQNNK